MGTRCAGNGFPRNEQLQPTLEVELPETGFLPRGTRCHSKLRPIRLAHVLLRRGKSGRTIKESGASTLVKYCCRLFRSGPRPAPKNSDAPGAAAGVTHVISGRFRPFPPLSGNVDNGRSTLTGYQVACLVQLPSDRWTRAADRPKATVRATIHG